MCITAIAWQLFDELPLVLLSNRDEFFDRPTTVTHQWHDMPIYAGRDNKSGGTWLGIHQQPSNPDSQMPKNQIQDSQSNAQNGRWATVLNFRDGVQSNPNQRSRGEIVTKFLTSTVSPLAYARSIELKEYAGFNLIIGDATQAVIVNNRGYPPTLLHSGLHVISNGQPDNDWFKTQRLRGRIRQEVLPLISESIAFHNSNNGYWQTAAWDVLSDTCQAPEHQLPQTGGPQPLEQSLSSICINTRDLPNYGTRTQSILTMQYIDNDNLNSQHNLKLISREYDNLVKE